MSLQEPVIISATSDELEFHLNNYNPLTSTAEGPEVKRAAARESRKRDGSEDFFNNFLSVPINFVDIYQ